MLLGMTRRNIIPFTRLKLLLSKPWFAPTNAIYFLGCNLAIGATFTHVFLWYLPEIRGAIASYRASGHDDPHYRKMQVYKEAPMWW